MALTATGLGIFNLVIAAQVLIFGLVIKTGKASFLISGYNTMSPGEKARIDEKKLSRFYGKFIIWSSVPLVIGGILALFNISPLMIWFWVPWGLFMAILVGGTIYVHVRKPFYIDVIRVDINNPQKRDIRMIILITVIASAIGLAVAGYVIIGGSRPADFIISDNDLSITGMYGETIALSDIEDVMLKDSLPTGLVRVNGAAVSGVLKGNFEAPDAKMKIFADTSSPHFIYLYTSVGNLYIINYKSMDDTNALYQKLASSIK